MAHKRKIVELENVEEPQSKKLKLSSTLVDVKTTTSFLTAPHLTLFSISSSNPLSSDMSFSSLPPEIFSHHILNFFDFRDWLKLVIVCKQWQLAAQQSTLNKQLVYQEKLEEPVACSILSKYHVNTLVVNTYITHQQLERLLASSPSITTLVTDSGNIMQEKPASDSCNTSQRVAQYPQITTLSTGNSDLLRHFIKVTKLRLLSHQYNDEDTWSCALTKECIPKHSYPSVQELEINAQQSDLGYFKSIKRAFPSLKKLYMNYEHNDRPVKILEEVSEQLNVTIIHDNPHFSLDVDKFSLEALSYHEYFNGFGQTPMQMYLKNNEDMLCQELFKKYSSRQYEKDLYHREPQFNFPLRCPKFIPNTSKTLFLELDRKSLLTMVECRYIDYWRAIGMSILSSRTKDRTIALLRQSGNYMPPTHHAVKSIPHILSNTDLSLHDVIGAISSEVFNLILTLRSKNRNTVLHYCARENSLCRLELYELFARFIDFGEENCKNENAATVAFNHKCWNHWQKIVASGAEVQTHLYEDFAATEFLKGVILSDLPLSTLSLLHQQFIQKLLWLLVGYDKNKMATDHGDKLLQCYEEHLLCQGNPQRYQEMFDELVRLGANPRERSYGTTLVCIMAARRRTNWSMITKYKLDINEPNQRGLTPLMISIQNGSYSLAKDLLVNRADPNVRTTDTHGRANCAVFSLTEVNEIKVRQQYINLLQQYNTDFAVEDECGNTIINRVAAHERRYMSTYIQFSSIDKPNHYGYTPLATAINQRNIHAVAELIAGGSDPNITAGPLKQPPFVLALETGHQGTIFELLSCRKVDIRIKDRVNRSFIYYLFKTEQYNFLNVLLGSQNGLLIEILRDYNTPENIEFIKSELAVVLSTPELSRYKTNLMLTALHSFPLLTFLIDVLGIDINIEDQNGDTMLLMVDNYTKLSVIEFLLARGANVNHQNKQGNTTLMLAIENRIVVYGNHKSLISLLIKAGASLTIENMWGVSPLKADPSLKSYLFIK